MDIIVATRERAVEVARRHGLSETAIQAALTEPDDGFLEMGYWLSRMLHARMLELHADAETACPVVEGPESMIAALSILLALSPEGLTAVLDELGRERCLRCGEAIAACEGHDG